MHKPKGSKHWKLFVEVDGKYKVAFKHESKQAVKNKRAEIQSNSIDKTALVNKKTFVELYKEFAEAKLEAANKPLGPKLGSVRCYIQHYNKWIYPYFDKKILLNEVTVKVAKEYFLKIYQAGASWITANNVVKTFKTALKYAVEEELISSIGPMDSFKAKNIIELKAHNSDEMEYKVTPMITLQQARALLRLLKPKTENDIDEWLKFTIACVFVFCGLRMSELRGLRWHNINLLLYKLSIKETLVGAEKGYGKTKSARRTFTIHPFLHTVLKTWKTIHYKHFKDRTSYVFASHGKYSDIPSPVCERTITDFLNIAYDNLGLAKVKQVTDVKTGEKRVVVEWSNFKNNPTRTFRHFSSTSLVDAQAGNPILNDNFIRNYQGHENIETTRGIYAKHLNRDTSPERLSLEAEALAAAIPINWEEISKNN
jgi:integrase